MTCPGLEPRPGQSYDVTEGEKLHGRYFTARYYSSSYGTSKLGT
jgi:hypothetical protein